MSSPLPASASAEPLSVSALNRAVAGVLARGFPLVRVRGEIGNLTRAASGHWYFTLKDDAAQVRCVMFRGRNALVDFAPREGDEVELRASVGLYEARGEFQLTVESMQRAGQGRLFEEFMRLKRRLAAEGLFDEALKRPLPRLPRTIGIVTSPQAAALRDVLTALRRRAPYARLIVYPVPVQGAGAGAQIAAMLMCCCWCVAAARSRICGRSTRKRWRAPSGPARCRWWWALATSPTSASPTLLRICVLPRPRPRRNWRRPNRPCCSTK
jgi:exodeoxyribonuclease VII large subunit